MFLHKQHCFLRMTLLWSGEGPLSFPGGGTHVHETHTTIIMVMIAHLTMSCVHYPPVLILTIKEQNLF